MSPMNTDKALVLLDTLLDGPADLNADRARRVQGLRDSKAAAIYLPDLERLRTELRKPRGQRDVSVFNELLRVSNITHDRFGRAFWNAATGVMEDPGASEAAQKAAKRVLEVFLPAKSELKLDTLSEIANAQRRAPLVETHAADLAQVPAADGRTGRDLVEGMITAARQRADALDDRGSQPVEPEVDGSLWAQTWGLLNEFRRALVREIANNPALPRDLEKLVFGMMDEALA